jgi:2-dehydro-3-deoxyphosphogluconate aldolase / (4S)-4-hydroxy-2-oxoglutarate aldolase
MRVAARRCTAKDQYMIYEILEQNRVVPVIAIDDARQAVPLADALIAGGLPVAEITFRTEAAAQVIEVLSKERPGLLVGAGTVLTVDNLKRAVDCGARFAVAPGLNPKVLAAALELGFPFAPGVMTPSDVEIALDLGARVLKFFPAEAAGGLRMLSSLAAPYAHTGVKFIPTGGITAANFGDYLAQRCVLAVGGTWIAQKADIAAGRWDLIRGNCEGLRAGPVS